MNVFNITGKIYKDLTLRMTPSGKNVLDLPIAITNGKDDTTFLTITTFGKTAENIVKYCHKGDTLGVEGIIKNHNWEDKNKVKHYDYSFLASRVEFLNIKKQEQQETQQEPPKKDVIYPDEIGLDDVEITDADLPF